MKSKSVLVLGATGNLGSYSALALKEAGFKVIASGRRKSDNGFFASRGIPYCSIDLIEENSLKVLLNEDIDIIANFAGELPSRCAYRPQMLIRSITESTVNIMEFMREKCVKKIIFPTTPYDLFYLHETGVPMGADELRSYPSTGDHSIYAIAKNAAVDVIEHYHHEYDISRFILRFFTIYQYHPNAYHYADGKMRKMPYRMLIDKAKNGEPITIYGDPQRIKEMVYIKDFTQVVVNAAKSELSGGIFNIGSKERVSLEKMIHGIVEVFSPNDNVSKISYDHLKPDTLQSILDSDKTKDLLGYEPKYSYIEMLLDMKEEMDNEPYSQLWGVKEDYEDLYKDKI